MSPYTCSNPRQTQYLSVPSRDHRKSQQNGRDYNSGAGELDTHARGLRSCETGRGKGGGRVMVPSLPLEIGYRPMSPCNETALMFDDWHFQRHTSKTPVNTWGGKRIFSLAGRCPNCGSVKGTECRERLSFLLSCLSVCLYMCDCMCVCMYVCVCLYVSA